MGGAANSWFLDTKIGVWFYEKVDDISTWSAKKLNIKILSEEEAWRKKYPNIAKKLDALDKRIKEFENND